MESSRRDPSEQDERILAALYARHPEPCGYNQLLHEAHVNKKVLDSRLDERLRPISLVYRGQVKVSKGRKRNSPLKITLTKTGRRTYMRYVGGKIKDAFQLITRMPEERMREVLRRTMGKVFAELVTHEARIKDYAKLDVFLRALEEPYMDMANRQLKGLRRKARVSKGPPPHYYLARFTLERAPWLMLRDDALLALKNKHWISPTRIRLLATLGLRKEHQLNRHNEKWLSQVKQQGKDPEDQKEEEYKIREPTIREDYPNVFIVLGRTEWNNLKYG